MTTSPRWLLVQRADADPGDRERVEALARSLGDHAEVRRTEDPADLGRLVEDLDGATLVVCGGDGSLHAAVNRLHVESRLTDTTVGLFPAGTGNDLSRTLGLPDDPAAMADLLRADHRTAIDLIGLGEHGVATNAVHAGIGVDAAERSQGLPDALGALAYPLGALLAGVNAEGFTGEVHVDGEPLVPTAASQTLMVLVMNGATIGGGHVLAPAADPSDGMLDVVVCHATGMATRAAFGTAVTRGTHLERDDVASAQGRAIRITGPDLAFNVDGELWLEQRISELTLEALPNALTMVTTPAR